MGTLSKKIGMLNNTAQQSTEQVVMSSLKTIIEMLHDRGHTSIQACQTFDELVQNMTDGSHVVRGSGFKLVHVFFHNEDRVGVKQLRNWVENSTADDIIIVSLDGPTSFTRKEAEQNYSHVQFFLFKEVCVNITKHVLVPKHERVDSVPFVTTSRMSELPSLYTNDRVAQYYNYAPGDIVRITRTCGVQEPIFYYRLVCAPPSA